jgi:biopolymer transport protein ExbD
VAEFTLARGATGRVEELDLAAMVDVAFQLVLFFLVTATTVLFKTLEVPRPSPDHPPAAAAQGQDRTLDDLQRDFILVEIDPQGAIRVDHEPVAADALIERLRRARQDTARTAMLLSADFATPHRNAVRAYDAANEIGLRIAIARPAAPGAAPAPPAGRGPPRRLGPRAP